MAVPAGVTFLSFQMNKYRFMSLRYYSFNSSFLSLSFALKFLRLEQIFTTIDSVRLFYADSIFDFEIPSIYCLLRVVESFFDKEESLPLEEGLTAGNYSTFFNEFLRIKVGLFPTLADSAYRWLTKDSRLRKIALVKLIS